MGGIPVTHVSLAGAVGGDLGEIGEQMVGMGRPSADGLLPGRFPCFMNGIRLCLPYVPVIGCGDLWVSFGSGYGCGLYRIPFPGYFS